jgi:hypothetical protein
MIHRRLPVLSCQYHPEASPGPHDSRPWFRAFREVIAARRPSEGIPPPQQPVVAGATQAPAFRPER